MVETLAQRLHESADALPDDHFDPGSVLRAGRGRVRRRRAAIGGAALATLAVIGSVPLALSGGEGTGDGGPAVRPVGEQLTLADATAAVEGRDYTVEATYASADTEASGGPFVRGITPDGSTVLQRYPGGMADLADAGQVGLAAPGEDVRWLTDTPPSLGNYVGTVRDDLLFEEGGAAQGGEISGFWVYETTAERWRKVTDAQGSLPMFDTSGGPVAAGTDQLIGSNGPVYDEPRTRLYTLWTRPGGESTRFAQAGNVAQRGTTYAYTDTLARPNGEVTVGDLGGGEQTTFDPGTGDCRQISIGLAADAVVVGTNCAVGKDPDVMTDIVDRIDVFDLEGNPLVRITGTTMSADTSDRWLTIRARGAGVGGVYAYSFEDGRFLRLTESLSGFSGDSTGSGDRLVWESSTNDDRGVTFTVATLLR